MATLQWGRSPSQSVGAHVAFCLFAIVLLQCARDLSAAPVVEQTTELETFNGEVTGCYYNFQHYNEGDRIITNEPCLNCTCHNRMLMCYLRVCPFTKAIGQDCKIEKRPDQCCPIISCPEVPVQLLTSTTTTSPATDSSAVGHLDHYGCTINELFYSDGARVPSDPNKPCELCYCIRNRTACVMQECTLHVEGCHPVYQDGVCCPVRYDCDQEENLLLETTVRPTPGLILTTTLAPGAVLDCTYNGEIYTDGELIPTDKPCEHCYCMRSEIVCAVQDCGTPLEHHGKNCTAVPPREGQCCPETYECDNSTMISEEITTFGAPTDSTEHILDDNRKDDEHTESDHVSIEQTTATIPASDESKDEENSVPELSPTTEAAEEHHEMHVTESDLLHPKPESDNSIMEHEETNENEIPIKSATLKPSKEPVTDIPESAPETTESKPFINRFHELDHTTAVSHEEPSTGSDHDNEIPSESDNVLTNEVHHDEVTPTTDKPEDDQHKPEETTEDDSSKTEIPPKTVHSKLDVESEVPTTETHLEDGEPSQTETNHIPSDLDESHDSNAIEEVVTEYHEVTTEKTQEDHHEVGENPTDFHLETHSQDQTEEPAEFHVPTSFPDAESSTEHKSSDVPEHHDDVQEEITEEPSTLAPHDDAQKQETIDEELDENAIPQHSTESVISSTQYSHIKDEDTEIPIEHKPEHDTTEESVDEQKPEEPEHDVKLENIPETTEEHTETYHVDVTESHTITEEKPEEDVEEQKPEVVEDHQSDLTPVEHEVTETSYEHTPEVTEHVPVTTETQFDHKPETFNDELEEPQTSPPVESKPETVESDETSFDYKPETTETNQIKSETVTTEALPEQKPEEIEVHHVNVETEAPIETTSHEITSDEHQPEQEKHQPEVYGTEKPTSRPSSNDLAPEEVEHKPEVEEESKPEADLSVTTETVQSELDVKDRFPEVPEPEYQDEFTKAPVHVESVTQHSEEDVSSHETQPEVTTATFDDVKVHEEESVHPDDDKVDTEYTSEHQTTEQPTSDVSEIEEHHDVEPQTTEEVYHKTEEVYHETEEVKDHVTEFYTTTAKYTPEEHETDEKISHDVYPEKQEPGTEEVQRPEEQPFTPTEGNIQPIAHAEIPGEGDCLVDGITYHNNSDIPPANHCHVSCHCVNSIIHCRLIECTPPPPNMVNCMPIYHGADSCCPTYNCEGIENDILESGNQMLEHHPTTPPKPVEDASEGDLETVNRIGQEETTSAEVHHDETVPEDISTVSSVEEKHPTESVDVHPVYVQTTEAQAAEKPVDDVSSEEHSSDDSAEIATEISVVTSSSHTVSDTTESSNKFTQAEEEKHTESSEEDDKRGLHTTKQPEDEAQQTTTTSYAVKDENHSEEISTEAHIYYVDQKPTEQPEIAVHEDKQEEVDPEISDSIKHDEATTSLPYYETETEATETHEPHETPEYTVSKDELPSEGHEEHLTEEPVVVTETEQQSVTEEVVHDETTESGEHLEHEPEQPEKVHEEPEKVNEEPEHITEEPKKVHEEPEHITEEPEKAHEEPEHITEEPEKVNEEPEHITEEPEKVHEEPEHITEEPEKVNEEPEHITEEPENVHEEPEHITEEPEKAHEEPEKVHEEPEHITEEPEKVYEEPEHITEEPEKIYEEPEKVYEEPEITTAEAERITDEPQKVHEEPEKIYEVPEQVYEKPQSTDKPEKVTDEPEKVYEEPEKVTEEPEQGHEEPEKVTDEPEKVHEEPEKVHEEPELIHEEPEQIHEELEKVTEEPEKVHEDPEQIHEEVEKVTEEPEKVAEESEEVTEESEKVTEEPEKVYEEPEKTHEEPEKVHEEPVEIHEEPEKVTDEPETIHEEPEGTHEEPEKVHEEPEETHEEPEKIHNEQEESHITTLGYEEVTDSKVEPEVDEKISFPVGSDHVISDSTTALPSHEEHTTYTEEEPAPIDHTTEHIHVAHHDGTSDNEVPIDEETTEKINDRFGDQQDVTTESHHQVTEEHAEEVVTESQHKHGEVSEDETISTHEVESNDEVTTESKEHFTTEPSIEHHLPTEEHHEEQDKVDDTPVTESNLAAEPVHEDVTTEGHRVEISSSSETTVTEQASTEHDIQTSKPIETTQAPAYDAHTEKEIDATTEKETFVSSTEHSQEPNYVQVPIEEHQKPIDDSSTHIPPPEIPGEGVYQKPVDTDYSAPSHPTGFGSHPDHNLEYPSGADDSEDYYDDHTSTFGPGTCRYGGKVYVSAQQIPRDDPCDFCFCFRSDIICLQQSCPPPIPGCHEEPIQGFCCPRYECPVSMATVLNTTTTTTTTTTTLPPHFLPHAYKGAASRRGCQIQGQAYQVGEVVRSKSGPCLHCTCGGDGQMKCDPKVCSPQPMIQQMIAAAAASRRR